MARLKPGAEKKSKVMQLRMTPQLYTDVKTLAYLCDKTFNNVVISAIEQFVGLNRFQIDEVKKAAKSIPTLPRRETR